MIVRPRPGSLELWVILRGSVVPTISFRVLMIAAFSAVLAVVHRLEPSYLRDITPAPFTLLGLALSIFLGFRNNACYERWWEARRQWGQLLAETRGLVRDAATLLPNEETILRVARRAVAFAHALRTQLRRDGAPGARDWLTSEEWERFVAKSCRPDAILHSQAKEFAALFRERALSDVQMRQFSDRLQAMTNIQAACERLSSTPTPFTYTLLLHRTAWMFCLLLPFGLVGTLGAATPVATLILAYAFFGLDALGEELEEPFGRAQNAVPIDALVRVIEIATMETLDLPDVPSPLEPHDYVLL